MLKQRVISGFFIVAFLAAVSLLDKNWFALILMALALIGLMEILLASASKTENLPRWQDWIYLTVVAGFFSAYFVWAFLVVYELRWINNGWWLFLAIAATSAYDTMAFLIGRTFGMHKIMPKISPKKTWEGTIGGFLGSIPASAIIGYYFLSLDFFQTIILGIFIGILAFFGDLSVSWYKRYLGVKDMGQWIPGHGGLLDRIDSHLLVLWGVFFLLKIA